MSGESTRTRIVVTVGLPPSGLTGNTRQHNINRAKLTKKYKTEAGEMLLVAKVEQGVPFPKPWKCAVAVEHFYFNTPRRRDVRNMVAGLKPVYDAFVAQGLIVDDDYDHLRHGPPIIEVVNDRPRVEIEIVKLDNFEEISWTIGDEVRQF